MPRVSRDVEEDDSDVSEERVERSGQESSSSESKSTKKTVRRKPAPKPLPAKKSRWKLYFSLLALASFVVLGPNLLGETPLRNYVLKVAAPKFPGRMTIGRAQIAWWKVPVLEEIVVTGPDGEDLLTVARISGNRKLFEIAIKPTSLGEYRIERPVLSVVVRPDGSNLEDAMKPMSSGRRSTSTSSRAVDGRIEVVEGKAEFIADGSRRRVALEDINVTLDSSSDPKQGLRTQLAAVLQSDDASAGKVRADITWKPPVVTTPAASAGPPTAAIDPNRSDGSPFQDSPADESLLGTVRIEGVRLETLDPLWTRLDPTLVVDGDFSADLRLRGLPGDDKNPPRLGAGGELTIDRLRVGCPAVMQGDELRLARTRFHGSLELRPGAIVADRVKITTEPVQLEAHGTFPLAALSDPGTWRQMWKTASSENYSLQADVNLAQLAAHLPNLLRIRNDVELTTGRLRATIESYEENGERMISGNVETSDLVAHTPTGSMTWPEPVACMLTARMTTDGPVVDRLTAKASFLDAAGRGTLKQARLLAKCDLDRFTSDVGRILDLREFQLSGRMSADCECRQSESDEGRVIFVARLGLDDFVWGGPGREPLREKRLNLDATAEAGLVDMRPEKLQTALIHITSDTDELKTELARPVMISEVMDHGGDIPVRLSVTGSLRRWLQRGRPWVALPGWTVDGDADISADIVRGAELITASNVAGTVRSLALDGPGYAVREQWVQVAGSAVWNQPQRQLSTEELNINGSSLSAKADRLSFHLPDGGLPTADGIVVLRGDLDRISRWKIAENGTPATICQGTLAGQLQAKQAGDAMSARFDLRVAGLAINSTDTTGGSRAIGDLTVTGEADYNGQKDIATLKKLAIASEALALDAAGTITAASTQPWAEVSGTASYDWQTLEGAVAAMAGKGVLLSGRRNESFTYKGPLSTPTPVVRSQAPVSNVSLSRSTSAGSADNSGSPPDDFWRKASGQTRFGWTKGDFYGMITGPVDLDVRLADGVLQSSPIDIAVSGGRVLCKPVVMMSPGPALLTMDKGRVVEGVQFTPEMCKNWVKYVAPMLADATEIDGKFSVELNGARVPLSEPKTGDVGGFLIVPRADVRPGPMAEQILGIARQIEVLTKKRSAEDISKAYKPLLTLVDQKIEFRLYKGRVHHRGLLIQVGNDLVIRTSGSVGLDETLSLLAEVPIQDDWVRKDRVLSSLQGQTIEIPIQGTFQRPQIDQRAYQDLARKLATGSATNAIQDELGKQLDKLFKRKP